MSLSAHLLLPVCDPAGFTVFLSEVMGSISPVMGDGNLLLNVLRSEEEAGIDHGLRRIFQGLPGFHVCLIMDAGNTPF